MKHPISNIQYPMILLLAISFFSCQIRKDMTVDFLDLEGAKTTKFQVIGTHETDLSQCYVLIRQSDSPCPYQF